MKSASARNEPNPVVDLVNDFVNPASSVEQIFDRVLATGAEHDVYIGHPEVTVQNQNVVAHARKISRKIADHRCLSHPALAGGDTDGSSLRCAEWSRIFRHLLAPLTYCFLLFCK